jgi:hypothetical protein
MISSELAPDLERAERVMRRRRIRVVMAVLVGLVLLAAAGVGALYGLSAVIGRVAREPWQRLRQVTAAVQTDGGAEALYAAEPGLAGRYPRAADFVTAARGWRAKLAALPEAAPGVGELLQGGGGSLNVSHAEDRVELKLTGYRGVSVLLATEGGRLVDLAVE